jgi:hypothetical protein
MYTLMRGLTAAFALGAVYHTGWALAGWVAGWGKLICIIVGAALFLFIIIGIFSLRNLQHEPVPKPLKWLTAPDQVQVRLRKFGPIRILLTITLSLFSLIAAYYFGLDKWSWIGIGIGLAGAFLAVLIPEFRKSPKGIRVSFLDLLAWLKVTPIMFALLALGYSSGLIKEISLPQRARLLAIALISLFASLKFYSSYMYFAEEFAKATYRDFVAYEGSENREENEDEEED